MRLKRRKVILLAGALILIWLVIVLLTPPPSTSESKRRLSNNDNSLAGADKLRTSYAEPAREAGKQNGVRGKLKDYADFDDFLPDNGAQNNNSIHKNESGIEKRPYKNKPRNDIDNALLDVELDLIPKKSSVKNASALWETAASWVTSKEICPESAPELGDVLQALSTSAILKADVGYKGTQLKARLVLEGGQTVVFKPGRYTRDHIIYGTPYAGYDRHNGEIAAFHLDRVLGFRRAPLVAGRTVNLQSEIKPVATQMLLDTFLSKDNNTCFYGKCYYCKPDDAACGHGDIMEGSVTLWLPQDWSLKKWRHLWSRTYRAGKKARWETEQDYCIEMLQNYPLDRYGIILDMVDAAVFDYLIGNADRHQYETFQKEGDQGMLLHLDNAKSFGNPHHDERSILAPLYQCCRLRKSLWNKIQVLRRGSLGNVMRGVLSHDPIAPILTDKHLSALDRRLGHIVTTVKKCFEEQGETSVLQ